MMGNQPDSQLTNDEFTDENLIFLVSQPRAGSTLLQTILGSLEQAHTTAEPWLMLHPLYALREVGHTADYDAVVAHRALREFLHTITDGEAHYLAALRAMSLSVYGTASRQAGKTIFIDKTPRYYKILPELTRVFPSAYFVILLRNPAAVLSSILRTWIKGDWTRFDYFRDDLMEAPTSLTNFMRSLGDRTIIVHYEKLILKPEETLREICTGLNQPYSPHMLHYSERTIPSGRYGDPEGIRHHDSPSSDSLNRWLEHAQHPQVHRLLTAYLRALGPDVLAQMGYDYTVMVAALDAVKQTRQRVAVTWEQVMKTDKSMSDKLWLIVQEGRQQRRPAHTAKQIARLVTRRI